MALFEYTHEVIETQANPITGEYTRVYIVKVDDNDITVSADQYKYAKEAADSLGLTTASVHPQDALSFVTSADSQVHHENDQRYWTVTVQYSRPDNSDQQTAPWNRSTTISASPAGVTKQATMNYLNDPDGEAILNSAGTIFLTQLTIKLPVLNITESGAELNFNVKSQADKVGFVNSGTQSLGGQSFPAGTLLLDGFTATEQLWEPTGQEYFEINANYIYNPEGHVTQFLDAGIQERKNGVLVDIRNANGVPIGVPVALDGSGVAQRTGTTLKNPVTAAEAVYIPILPYQEKNINVL